MRRWHAVLALTALLFMLSTPVQAAVRTDPVTISNVAVFYSFGSEVTFQASFEPGSTIEIKDIRLMIQPPGQNTRVIEVQPNSQGELIHQLDVSQNPLRPFAAIEYWYQIDINSEKPFDSAHFSFFYEDNRFEWQNLENSQFQLHWVEGGSSFGQDILTAAEQGIASVSNLVPANLPAPIRVYVYPNAIDLQSALDSTPQTWVAGHASPDLGVILLSIPVGIEQKVELERQIPHELMHLAQFQSVPKQYTSLPVWMLEGMASMAEIYPNPDFQSAIDQAVKNQSLLPLSDLCQSFPREASGAFLAYAQSESFMRFLHRNYGQQGLTALLIAYQNGLGCSEGVNAALNAPLSQLEYNWRQSLAAPDAKQMALNTLTPYLALASILLIPAIVVTFALTKKK